MLLYTPLQLDLHKYEVKNILQTWKKLIPDSSQDQQSNWKLKKTYKTCWTELQPHHYSAKTSHIDAVAEVRAL
jgi:hypothetical protein